jgi:D-alanine-D-alanine ligase
MSVGKIIGITYDLKTDWQRGADDPVDINAEFDKPETMERIIATLQRGGHTVRKIGNVHKLIAQLNDLDVDIVFNICEGVAGRNRESQVPALLELKGIPFVGSDALTLGVTLDKVVAKKLFIAEGIPTPRFFVMQNVDELAGLKDVRFPLIVKTRHEGTSKGITNQSRVEDLKALQRQVRIINNVYKQPALVEEFIKGTEFTVAVIGNKDPIAMPIAQVCIDGNVDLGDLFFSHEMVSATNLRYICPAKLPVKLTKKIQEIAVRVYKCVECRDFGRVDFRVDEQGNPYVLEINPLPSLDKQDVFNIFPQLIGSSYDEVVNHIVDLALKRYGMTDDEPVLEINGALIGKWEEVKR